MSAKSPGRVGLVVDKSMLIYAPGHNPNLPEYEFYNGTVKLRFDKSCWTYFLVRSDGSLESQDGVTKTVQIIDKSPALMPWAVKKAMAKLKRLLSERNLAIDDEEELDELIASAKKADREELEAAGEIGHTAHDWIEQYIKTILYDRIERRRELLAKMPSDARAANACIASLDWMHEHNVRWISTERKIFSLKYGYAGTMDGLARVDSCKDPNCCPNHFKDRLTLIDWKTSNGLWVEYLFQTAAYQQAIQEESGEMIEDRWVIRLGKEDAKFEPWHLEGKDLFEQDFQGFLQALLLLRSVTKAEERMSAVRAGKTAARRQEAKADRVEQSKLQCKNFAKYKGTRPPVCNGGHPCEACKKKYAEFKAKKR